MRATSAKALAPKNSPRQSHGRPGSGFAGTTAVARKDLVGADAVSIELLKLAASGCGGRLAWSGGGLAAAATCVSFVYPQPGEVHVREPVRAVRPTAARRGPAARWRAAALLPV